MRVDPVIGKIDALKAQWASDNLNCPADKTEFGYGHAVGVQRGLEMAKVIILEDDKVEKEANRNG